MTGLKLETSTITSLQIFAVTLFLYVVGIENWATMSPVSQLSYGQDDYELPQSRIFRFAVAGLVYIVIGTFTTLAIEVLGGIEQDLHHITSVIFS